MPNGSSKDNNKSEGLVTVDGKESSSSSPRNPDKDFDLLPPLHRFNFILLGPLIGPRLGDVDHMVKYPTSCSQARPPALKTSTWPVS